MRKDTVKFVARQAFYISMVGAALYLAANDKDGWGWILFVLLLIHQSE